MNNKKMLITQPIRIDFQSAVTTTANDNHGAIKVSVAMETSSDPYESWG
jgi:hypothetical protein